MSKLKNKKYLALLGLVILFIGLIGLILYGKFDKYKGLIKVKNVVSNTTVLSASVSNAVNSPSTSRGSDEIKYELAYTLDTISGVETRDVVILGTISDEEARYARFKNISGNNITSEVRNEGKEIEVHIDDVRLGEEQYVTLKLIIDNAPNGFKVKPNIKIKEETGEETNVVVDEVEVETNTLQGTVKDENNLPVSNIELSINDETGEVRRTYTDNEGRFIFSDIENKTYRVDVKEEIYEKESEEKVGEELNIKVKEVSPYEIEAHKYITKLNLVVNGKEENYTYDDLEKVVQVVKNAKTISGEITYKITVKNIGEKNGKLSKLIDKVDNGLSFNKEKNTGWKEKNGNLYYELLEDTVIKKGETKEIGLRLDIKNTNEIKTYINEIDVKGEAYNKVVYILNGRKYKEEVVVLGERITAPVISDDTFSGWYTDSNFTNKYNFKNEVTKDLILYGKTTIITHQVEFYDKDPETGSEVKWAEQEVEDGEKAIEPNSPTHRGYTFECWMDEHDNVWVFSTPVTRDLRLTSCYTKNKYTVLFMDGNTEYNRQRIEYKGHIEVPQNPSKDYYTFLYWHKQNEVDAYDLTQEVVEDVTVYSKYERNKHTVAFVDKYPVTGEVASREEVTVNEGEKVDAPTDPSKRGYNFVCWEDENGCYNFDSLVLTDKELTSKYEIIEYTISYSGITDGERETLDNPKKYTVETEEITLNNPSTRKDEYNEDSELFVGWTGSNGNDPSIEVKIPKGSIGNKTYTANWVEANPNEYPITYNLHDGTLGKDDHGQDITNPNSYTKKTETFTLNNPKKTGYNFTGWSGTDLVGQNNTTVTVQKGSRGARSYEAWYSPKEYDIEYVNTCGEVNNPSTYTIETETFSLNNPSKTGYEFTGWITEEDDTKVLTVTIPKGSTGNRKYIATCKPIRYDINYELDGGSLESGKTNPEHYTIETETFTLNNPGKEHYNFIGWTGTDLTENTTEVTIPQGSTGNRSYVAHYEKITHQVTFKDKDPENPIEETTSNFGDPVRVDDGDPVNPPQSNPTHTGFICDKWSTKINGDYNNDAYDFSSNVTTDLTLYTLCKKEIYTVTYMDGNDQYAEDLVPYKEKTTRPSTDPSKTHHIFLNWTLNNEVFDFNTEITGNITLYSSYEEVLAPEISHTPTTWTNQNVIVTVSKNSSLQDDTGYSYKYRINEGEYQDYTGPFEVEENCTVYAVAYKQNVPSTETSHVIDNIDKIKPIIDSLESQNIEKDSFQILLSGHDNESGLHEFRIYKDDEYVTTVTYTDDLNDEKEETYEFTGLDPSTVYRVKVVAVDVATNTKTSDEISVETTEDDRIVAQITHFDNVELSEYIPLSSVYKGLTWNDGVVNCGTNHQCTIQMLDNVTESNDVLEGQDITLDLNGYTINGKTAYTFTNNGKFKVIDTQPYSGSASADLMSNYIKNLANTDSSLKTDTTTDANVRYVGSNPNNYISFNGELWRIVGVMNNVYSSTDSPAEARLKIVRNDSIGSYSWDSSSENRGYGINEWSQADIMKLMNPGYEEESTGGSLYYNSASGYCYTSTYNSRSACDFTNTGLSISAQKMIDPAIWYTGSNGRDSSSYFSAINMYNYERGSLNGKICTSGTYCNDSVTRTTTWNGYVGLISPSDYGFATSGTSCTGTMYSFSSACYSNDWLNKTQWTITPYGYSSYASRVFRVNNTVIYSDASNTNPVYPTVYLKADLLYKSGTGTSTDPYILMTDAEYQEITSRQVNGIKNNTDTAIINNGTFTLGNIEATNDLVSETKPYIEGLSKGILNNNVFNFYDGKIKAVSAISGTVTDTPFPYNATIYSISEENIDKQIAVLKVVTDPEARIGNVYYSKTQKALDDASKGYLKDTFSEAAFKDSLLPVDKNTNSFVYDDENGYYTNNGLAAKSYVYIDLADYDIDQEFTIRTNNFGSSSYIYVRKNNPEAQVLRSVYVSTGENTYKVLLEHGQRYYITFEKSGNYDMFITDLSLANYVYDDYDVSGLDLDTEILNYTFDYDENTQTYKSNNQYVKNSTAFAYTEIDLTASETDKTLLVSAYLESYGSDDLATVRVSESKDFNNSDYNSLLYMKGQYNVFNRVGPYVGDTKLTKGKKYYLQFYYKKTDYGSTEEGYRANNNKDQFTINNIRLIDYVSTDDLNNYNTSGVQIDLSTELKTKEGDYGFVGSSYAPNNAGITGTIAHSYIKVDLTNETNPKYLKFDVSGYVNFELATTDSEDLPTGDYESYVNHASGSYINTYYQYYYANLTPGRINYVHLISRSSNESSFSISRVQMFDGEIINLNKLKKAQSKGFGLNTSGSYTGMYTPLGINTGETADGYIKLDLTDKTQDQLITANMYIRSGNNDKYMYITTNEKNVSYSSLANGLRNDALFYTDFKNGNTSYMYYSNGRNKYNDLYNYSFILPKGNVYYIHFGTYGNSYSSDYYDNQLLVKAMKCQPVNTDTNYKVGQIRVSEGTLYGDQGNYAYDDNEAKDFRFVGSNANNYMSFNGELWRVIGVFETEDENGNKDRRIKIMRNDYVANLSWDTSSSENNGNGINEWSQAKIMKLMNPGYENETAGGSLYWNAQSGNCYSGGGNYTTSCDFTNTGLSDSAKQYIDSVKWYTGAVNSNSNSLTPAQFVALEKGNATGKDNITIDTYSALDSVTRTTSWVGKVGLPYYSDYLYAAGPYYSGGTMVYTRDQCINSTLSSTLAGCISTNSWMWYSSYPMYTITPTNGGASTSTTPSYSPYLVLTIVGSSPYISTACATFHIKPTVYLNPKTVISGGDGSLGDPYTITMGDVKNPKKNYGFDETNAPQDDQDYHEETLPDNDIVKSNSIYEFELDSETGEYVNQNSNVINSIASSYFVLDLTNDEKDTEISFDYTINTGSSNNYGYIDIMKDEFNLIDYANTNRSNYAVRANGNFSSSYKVTLEHGSVYYIQFAYTKFYTSNGTDEFRIKMSYREDYVPTDTFTRFDGIVPVLNEEPDTVHLLKDVAVKTPLKVDQTQKVILDLEGYTLTTSNNSAIISNYGDLTIIDTIQDGSNTHTGNITSYTSSLIYNNEGGSLDVKEAILNTSKGAIINTGTLKVEENGILNISGEGTGISNGETGVILDSSGTINCEYEFMGPYYNTDSRSIFTLGTTSISNSSKIDTELKGFNINGGYISITTSDNVVYTINSINNATGGILNYGNGLIVKNSNFKSIATKRSIELDTTSITDKFWTQDSENIIIKGSTIKEFETQYAENVNISDSTVTTIGLNSISGGTFNSRPNTPELVLLNTKSTNIGGSGNKVTVKGNSEISIINLKYGEVIIGEKDGTVSTTYPKIGIENVGYTTGLISEDLYFYDGIITGKKNTVIDTKIVDLEDNYEVVGTEHDPYESIYLGQPLVARIGDVEYSSLTAAVEAAVASEQEVLIEVIDNIYNTKDVIVPSNKNIIIDYNGHKVTGYNEDFIVNEGKLKIIDLSGNPIYSPYTGNLVTNNGNLTLENIITTAIVNNNMDLVINSGEYDTVYNYKNITITGGKLIGGEPNRKHSCFVNGDEGVANITGGNFTSSLSNSHELNVTGGTFIVSGFGFVTTENAITTISSVKNMENNISFYTYAGATLIINDSDFTLASNTSNNYGIAEITGCNIKPWGVIHNEGNLKIKDSILNGTETGNTGGLIESYNITSGSYLEIDNTSIIGDRKAGIYIGTNYVSAQGDNVLNIKSGEISGGVGIVDQGHALVNIGEKDGIITEDNPRIIGTGYGIKSANTTSTINFYDGTITGPTNNSVSGVITNIEDDSDIITLDNGNGTETKYLSSGSLIKNVTQDIEYTNVQKAINESNSGDELEFLRDFSTTGASLPIEIGSTKNVTIDMNGFSLNYSGMNGSMFIIDGTLNFKNTEQTGTINNNTENSIFENNGTLVVDDVTGTVKYDSLFVDNTATGTATINNSTIDLDLFRKFINNDGIMFLNNDSFTTTTRKANNNLPFVNTGILTIDCGNYNIKYDQAGLYFGNLMRNTGVVNLNETIQNESLYMQGRYIYNNDTGVININGGTIKAYYYELNNNSTVNINGGFVHSNQIELKDSSTLNILGGTVEKDLGWFSNTIISTSTDSTITLGVKDGNVDISTPILAGHNFIDTSGTVNIYDGAIYGSTQPVMANVLNLEDDCTLVMEPKQYTIETNTVNGYSTHLIKGNVVENTNTGVQYRNVKDAIDNASSNDTLKLLQNGIVTNNSSIPANKTITLDLAGYSLISSVSSAFTNAGKFKIINSESATKSIILSDKDPFLTNNNELEIDGNIDINAKLINNQNHKFTLQNGTINKKLVNAGEFIMNGGVIKNYDIDYEALQRTDYLVQNTGTMVINGGSLLQKQFIQYSSQYKSNASQELINTTNPITINDCTVNNESNHAIIYITNSTATITIEDITYNGDRLFIESSSSGIPVINVNGGTYNIGTGEIFSGYNQVNITGGTFTTSNDGAIATGEINISNMTINNMNIGTMSAGVLNNVTATSSGTIVTIGNGTIKGNSTLTSTNSTAVITTGTATISENTTIISENGSAIHNSGTLTIGTNDNNVNAAKPLIKGTVYGIETENTSRIKFYDGIISGKTNPYGLTVMETAPNHIIRQTQDGDYKNASLILDSDVEKVASYNNINFPSLQAAINSCPTDGTTADVLIHTNITLAEPLTVPTGANIRVYLNGFTITPDEYITGHSGDGTITTVSGAPSGVGGAIYKFLANITGQEMNAKNIIIYQMEDGTELASDVTYKLYKLNNNNNYDLVNVDEELIGDYTIGNEKSTLRTTRGIIKINNIGEGTYRLSGSDGKELDFNITENGISNNIRENRYQSLSKKSVTAIATLILQLQTGITRHPFILVMIILTILIISLKVITKQKKEDQ